MTGNTFDQQLTLSLQRLEQLWQRVDELPQPAKERSPQANQGSVQQRELLMETLQELSKSLVELQVANEELRQQNEELAETHLILEAERQHYQNLFELAPDGYLVTTKESVIVAANRTAAKLFNVSPTHLHHKPLVVFVAAEARQLFYGKLKQLQRGESIKNWQIPIQAHYGICIPVSCTVIPVKDLQGQVIGLRWRFLELAPSESTVPLKPHLAAIAAHEFRNLLNTIVSCAQLIETNAQQWSDEKKSNHLQRIQDNAKQINHLLDDLLLLGKLEAGNVDLKPALVDLAEFCNELIQEIKQSVGFQHQFTFTHQGQRSGIWDEKLLRQMLKNLLLNSIRYSPKGSEIKLDVVCQNGQAKFCIQAVDSRIPQSDRELLFKSSHWASNIGFVSGSGLGFVIVKTCVDLQGGEISVDSEEGVGTMFTVALPLNLRKIRNRNSENN